MTSASLPQGAWLSSGVAAARPKLTQTAQLASRDGNPRPFVSQLTWLASLASPQSKFSDASQAIWLSSVNVATGPEVSQVAELICYSTGLPAQSRSRAWEFTLDGHTFYVLDLGAEGTWGYDVITKQWCHFYTQGFEGQWNFTNGVMWGDRIIGGDILYDYLWELDPNQAADEGWRPIMHVVTGAVSTRSRDAISCDLFHITGSSGLLQSNVPVTMTLRFSDDNAQTWSPNFDVTLNPGDTSLDIQWPSLGSFATPGRIFEISDSGGLIRIDGADAGLNNFDDDAVQQAGQ